MQLRSGLFGSYSGSHPHLLEHIIFFAHSRFLLKIKFKRVFPLQDNLLIFASEAPFYNFWLSKPQVFVTCDIPGLLFFKSLRTLPFFFFFFFFLFSAQVFDLAVRPSRVLYNFA